MFGFGKKKAKAQNDINDLEQEAAKMPSGMKETAQRMMAGQFDMSSTVGTVTEIYDYLRLLWARIGIPYSPVTGLPIKSQTIAEMVDWTLKIPNGTKFYILAPMVRERKGEYKKEIAFLIKQGYQRAIVDGVLYDLASVPALDKNKKHNIFVIIAQSDY